MSNNSFKMVRIVQWKGDFYNKGMKSYKKKNMRHFNKIYLGFNFKEVISFIVKKMYKNQGIYFAVLILLLDWQTKLMNKVVGI